MNNSACASFRLPSKITIIMGTRDARVDAYIAKSAPFAQPVLQELREIVHEGCPEVEETMKWSMPFFLYKGILCNMSGFKEHCAFGFWKGRNIPDAADTASASEAMGQFGRITTLQDLPSRRTLVGYIKKARQLRDNGVKAPSKPRVAKAPLLTPDYLAAALRKNKKASAAFEAFPPSHRREYIEWLIDAKTEATRQRRLETAIEWIAEKKSRNWKYEKC
jgi:uncharacterized protein YdeI (YjbR/CyaY-like superfamily)